LDRRTSENNPELGTNVWEAIKKCNAPYLKTLNVNRDMRDGAPGQYTVKSLRIYYTYSQSAALLDLKLYVWDMLFLVLPIPGATADHWIVPENQANQTLKRVTFEHIVFGLGSTIGLLCNLRVLTELNLTIAGRLCNFKDTGDAIADDSDGSSNSDDDSTTEQNIGRDYWMGLIHHCPALCKVFLQVTQEFVGAALFVSLMKGTLLHGNLHSLTLHSMYDVPGIDGDVLRMLIAQLLRESPCMKYFSIHDTRPRDDFAAGLADGLIGNDSLDNFILK
jgi:hypothetical protein